MTLKIAYLILKWFEKLDYKFIRLIHVYYVYACALGQKKIMISFSFTAAWCQIFEHYDVLKISWNFSVSGMKHLRQNGFSHCDIKPGNILVCIADDGRYDTNISKNVTLWFIWLWYQKKDMKNFILFLLQIVMSTSSLTLGQLNRWKIEISSNL